MPCDSSYVVVTIDLGADLDLVLQAVDILARSNRFQRWPVDFDNLKDCRERLLKNLWIITVEPFGWGMALA